MNNINLCPKINSYSANYKSPTFKGSENSRGYVNDARRFLHETGSGWKTRLFKEVYQKRRAAAPVWNRANNPRGLERLGIDLLTGGLYEFANLWRHVDTMLADRQAAKAHVAKVGKLIQQLKKGR